MSLYAVFNKNRQNQSAGKSDQNVNIAFGGSDELWRDIFGEASKDSVYHLLTRDLPKDSAIMMIPRDDHVKVTLNSRLNGQPYLTADMEFTSSGESVSTAGRFYLDEIRIHSTEKRRSGYGKIFFDNLINFCDSAALDRITMRGGREDGAYFWSRRGGYIQDGFAARVTEGISENFATFLEDLGDNPDFLKTYPDFLNQQKPEIDKLIDNAEHDINVALCERLKGFNYKDEPLAKFLMRDVNPRLIFQLKDDKHRQVIRDGLHNVTALRQNHRDRQERPDVTPQTATTETSPSPDEPGTL